MKEIKTYQVNQVNCYSISWILNFFLLYFLQKGWSVGPDNFFHFRREEKEADDVIPAKLLAEQTIEYARELEMIV